MEKNNIDLLAHTQEKTRCKSRIMDGRQYWFQSAIGNNVHDVNDLTQIMDPALVIMILRRIWELQIPRKKNSQWLLATTSLQ